MQLLYRFVAGILFFAASNMQAERAATAAGPIIQTYAGADWTFQADGKPAINAPFGDVNALALDSLGNLYIADGQNYQVYRVNVNGVINVFGGNGFDAPGRAGIDARSSPLNRPIGVTACPD